MRVVVLLVVAAAVAAFLPASPAAHQPTPHPCFGPANAGCLHVHGEDDVFFCAVYVAAGSEDDHAGHDCVHAATPA